MDVENADNARAIICQLPKDTEVFCRLIISISLKNFLRISVPLRQQTNLN